MVSYGVVHVKFHRYFLTFLISFLPFAVTIVEILEYGFPSILCRLFAANYFDSLTHHFIGKLLVIPTILYPHSGFSIPLSHAG